MRKAQLGNISHMSDELKNTLSEEYLKVFEKYENISVPVETDYSKQNPLWKRVMHIPFNLEKFIYLLDDLESVSRKYFLIKEIDFISENQESYYGGRLFLNTKFSNKLYRIVKISMDSIYPNLIYKKLVNGEMLFNRRYLEFIYPLAVDIWKNNKKNIVLKSFINSIYGMIGSNKTELLSNIQVAEITNYYREVLDDIIEKVDDVIYIDTDTIYLAARTKSSTLLVESILNNKEIKYTKEDIGDIGLFIRNKNYLIFDSEMITKKCGGMRVY